MVAMTRMMVFLHIIPLKDLSPGKYHFKSPNNPIISWNQITIALKDWNREGLKV